MRLMHACMVHERPVALGCDPSRFGATGGSRATIRGLGQRALEGEIALEVHFGQIEGVGDYDAADLGFEADGPVVFDDFHG